MKKNIFALAAAVAMLGMTACQKEENNDIVLPEMPGTEILVKSAADLIGTEWTYTLSFADMIDEDLAECLDGIDLDMVFGLSFDADYAHLTFPENVIGLNVVDDSTGYTIDEIQQMDYVYTYDPTTFSGTLTGGNLDTYQMPFTYDDANDGIIVSLMVASDLNDTVGTPMQLIFARAN